jgi:lipoate-protein ligase B
VEHPHVYTLGKSGDLSNLLLSEKQLEEKNATYKINRVEISYHGPGQIVGYPIIDLENFTDILHKYRFSEEAIILTLQEYGIERPSDGETGVWLVQDAVCRKFVLWCPCFALGYHARICFKINATWVILQYYSLRYSR